jgi:hypothetical protein
MANKQTTAVEWLIEQTRKPEWHSLARGEIFEQALEMEREQIQGAYSNPLLEMSRESADYCLEYLMACDEIQHEAETYYADTYGKE